MGFIAADDGNRGVLNTFSTGLNNALERDSVAFNVGTLVTASSWRVQIPRLEGHTSVSWLNELEPIPATDVDIDTADTMLRKVAGRSVISNEAWYSQATDLVALHGRDLKQQIVRSVDSALFGPKSGAKAPDGLEATPDLTTFSLDKFDSLDAIYAAASHIASGPQGFTATSVVMHPSTLLRVRTMKESDTSRKGLVEVDPVNGTAAAAGTNTSSRLAGLDVYTTTACPVGVVWVVAKDGLVVARSGEPEVTKSDEAAFDMDAVVVRATLGVAFGATSSDTAVKIVLPAEK